MKNWNGFDKVEIEVTKINEIGNTEIQSLLIDAYDIEKTVDDYGQEMEVFNGLTGEVAVEGIKHIAGGKTKTEGCRHDVIWNNDKIEITVYDVENVKIRLSFTIINEENEEEEMEIEVSTSFNY